MGAARGGEGVTSGVAALAALGGALRFGLAGSARCAQSGGGAATGGGAVLRDACFCFPLPLPKAAAPSFPSVMGTCAATIGPNLKLRVGVQTHRGPRGLLLVGSARGGGGGRKLLPPLEGVERVRIVAAKDILVRHFR